MVFPSPYFDLLVRIKPLPFDEFGKKSTPVDQLVIRSGLNDASAVENEDPVAVPDRRKPVRDHDPRAAHCVQRFRDLLLRPVVKGRGGLVKHQDLRFRRNRAGDHQPLRLASGDAALAFRDHRKHSHGHRAYIVRDPGFLGGFPCVIKRELGSGDDDV